MVFLHRVVFVLASLPRCISSSNVTTDTFPLRTLGLRPEFVSLLGEEAVDRFIANAWKRSVTELQVLPKFNSTLHRKTASWLKPDGSYDYGHSRFDALGPVLQCPSSLISKFGVRDEEKHVCGLPTGLGGKLASVTSGSSEAKKSCVIISVGSHNQWNFEMSIGRALPHCHIHTLDCTVYGKIPVALKHQVTFHHVCIGTETKIVTAPGKNKRGEKKDVPDIKMQFMRWTDFTKKIGLEEPPDVMKMDIEGFEWSVLTDLAANTPPHLLPRSISLELHYETRIETLPSWNSRLRSPYEIGAWMDFMVTRGNYILVDRNDNEFCKHCSEIVIAHIPPSKEPARGY
jgi:hypothetical protein